MPPGDWVAEGGTYASTGQINIPNNSACFNGKRNTKHFSFVSHEQTSIVDLLDQRTTNRTCVPVKWTSRNASAFCSNRHTRHKGVIKTSQRFIVRESTQGHSWRGSVIIDSFSGEANTKRECSRRMCGLSRNQPTMETIHSKHELTMPVINWWWFTSK